MRYFRFFFLYVLTFSTCLITQAQDKKSGDYDSLNSLILHHSEMALKYLENAQHQVTDSPRYFKGEWGSIMEMNSWFPILGSYQRAYDSNCFALTATFNLLAKIYLLYPEYESIPPMLNKAYPRVITYSEDGSFNFWNKLPPTKPMRHIFEPTNPLVRRPNNFNLSLNFVRKAANVANDADDTSAGYLAMHYYGIINEIDFRDSLSRFQDVVTSYRDENRRNRHWYNLYLGIKPNTGAYLTWLAQEHQHIHNWNLLTDYLQAQLFYTPLSKMYPHAYQAYIPFGTNDLDPVVNANVLTSLHHLGLTDAKGYDEAVAFINQMVVEGKFDRAATYYPNRYQMHYYISRAYESGTFGLEQTKAALLNHLVRTQLPNGSWISDPLINDGDTLQSTLYALNTIIHFSALDDDEIFKAALKAIDFVLNQKIKTLNGYYWKGGVMFSGGTVVRNVLFWKSDAFTTALTLESLIGMRQYVEKLKSQRLSYQK